MSIVTLLPFIVLIGAMFLMTRSAKKKQAAAASMRNEVQPGVGVRTIGGMFATVKEVHDEMVLLEVAPGVHAVYAKNAIGSVLDDEEYNRIVHGEDPAADLGLDAPVVPDDASSLTEGEVSKIDLGKKPGADLTKSDAKGADADAEDAAGDKPADDAEPKDAAASDAKGEAKTDGESGTK
ncbi:preprotein translocase subunit YajC [Streptomyces sp. 8L]|uniref:preprotein translocase subunit YajC n=1 Tax=Streptomyces sp. 8L TaxID=2877242 RepID=UPI001CD7F29C|nr:preprotein translocase subunit YajC [Streptomyces sp. 8L]MCA1223353.1 preprotein translocase subunit YajC [Streptomyces sp. 8L]